MFLAVYLCGQVSLFAGLSATFLVLAVELVGLVAGFYGDWSTHVMRTSELILALRGSTYCLQYVASCSELCSLVRLSYY